MIDEIRYTNINLEIKNIRDEAFNKYGRMLDKNNFNTGISYMKDISIPNNGNIYIADDKNMFSKEEKAIIKGSTFGGLEIQTGYCNGNSSSLNAFEFHKSPEINVAVTDMILILGDSRDIVNNKYDSDNAEIFFLEKGNAVELYSNTLHFAPIRVEKEGFKCIVILPKHTNDDLDSKVENSLDEDKLLWKTNKWLLCHKDSIQAKNGVTVGIYGDNINICI